MKPFQMANYSCDGWAVHIVWLIIFKAEMALEVLLLMDIGRAPVRDHSKARAPCIQWMKNFKFLYMALKTSVCACIIAKSLWKLLKFQSQTLKCQETARELQFSPLHMCYDSVWALLFCGIVPPLFSADDG